MRIIGHGVDLVEVSRISWLLERHGEDFVTSWFTLAEEASAPMSKAGKTSYFAGLLAAKEAVVKALGTGLIGNMAWTEIEIKPRASGTLAVGLLGETGRIADSLSVKTWLLSISHTDKIALASVIALGE